jgi:hypothetical protein
MRIRLIPQLGSAPIRLERSGDALTVNGETFDFGPLEAGSVLPADAIESSHFPLEVRRTDEGELIVPVRFPHGPRAGEAARFPAEIADPPDGPVALPDFGY